jgi:hypothetical protein
MLIGYARISTEDQNLNAQLDGLTGAGAGRIFADMISGSKRQRPELNRLLDQLRDGVVVIVTKYDRLAQSLRDLLDIVQAISDSGAGFRSLAEDIDTTTPSGRLVFHVLRALPSSSASGFPGGRVKDWTLRGGGAGLGAAHRPCRARRGPRSGGCGTRSFVHCPKSRNSSESA